MDWIVTIGLAIGGAVHILPLPGILGSSGLARLYDIRTDDPNLLILLRHRSAVFAILGLLLVAAIFRPELQSAAILAGLTSALLFAVIALQTGGYSPALKRVVIADVVAIVALAVAGLGWLLERG